MNIDEFIEDAMDADIQSYTDDENYKLQAAYISKMISSLREDLTSKAQREQLKEIVDKLSDEKNGLLVCLYHSAFKAGMNYRENKTE